MSAAGSALGGLMTADAVITGGLAPTPSLAWVVWTHIEHVLADCGGNVSEAARRLGIARRTLQLKRKKNPPRW